MELNRLITTDVKSYQVAKKQTVNFFLLDIEQKNVDINLNFDLPNESKMNLFCLVSNIGFDKKINININHLGDNSCSICEIRAINKEAASSHFLVKTNANQNLKNIEIKQNIEGILLDDNSTILAIPSLNVNTDSINAFHSVNVGKINPNIVFYLMSRKFNLVNTYSIIFRSYFEKFFNNAWGLNIDPKALELEITKLFMKG